MSPGHGIRDHGSGEPVPHRRWDSDLEPWQRPPPPAQQPASAATPIIRSNSQLSVRDPQPSIVGGAGESWSRPGGPGQPQGLGQYGYGGYGLGGAGDRSSDSKYGRGTGGGGTDISRIDLLPPEELDALIARNSARMSVLNRALAAAAAPPGADAAAAAVAAAAGEAVLERYLRRQQPQVSA